MHLFERIIGASAGKSVPRARFAPSASARKGGELSARERPLAGATQAAHPAPTSAFVDLTEDCEDVSSGPSQEPPQLCVQKKANLGASCCTSAPHVALAAALKHAVVALYPDAERAALVAGTDIMHVAPVYCCLLEYVLRRRDGAFIDDAFLHAVSASLQRYIPASNPHKQDDSYLSAAALLVAANDDMLITVPFLARPVPRGFRFPQNLDDPIQPPTVVLLANLAAIVAPLTSSLAHVRRIVVALTQPSLGPLLVLQRDDACVEDASLDPAVLCSAQLCRGVINVVASMTDGGAMARFSAAAHIARLRATRAGDLLPAHAAGLHALEVALEHDGPISPQQQVTALVKYRLPVPPPVYPLLAVDPLEPPADSAFASGLHAACRAAALLVHLGDRTEAAEAGSFFRLSDDAKVEVCEAARVQVVPALFYLTHLQLTDPAANGANARVARALLVLVAGLAEIVTSAATPSAPVAQAVVAVTTDLHRALVVFKDTSRLSDCARIIFECTTPFIASLCCVLAVANYPGSRSMLSVAIPIVARICATDPSSFLWPTLHALNAEAIGSLNLASPDQLDLLADLLVCSMDPRLSDGETATPICAALDALPASIALAPLVAHLRTRVGSTLPHNLIQGNISQYAKCHRCATTVLSGTNVFTALSLDMPLAQGATGAHTVSSLLSFFFATGDVTDFACSACRGKAKAGATLSRAVVEPPILLVIDVKAYNHDESASAPSGDAAVGLIRRDPVAVDSVIDMSPYLVRPGKNIALYDLCGVTWFIGSTGRAGHYVSDVCVLPEGDRGWYTVDDYVISDTPNRVVRSAISGRYLRQAYYFRRAEDETASAVIESAVIVLSDDEEM